LTRCVQEVTGSHRAGRGTLSWSRCSSRPFLEAVRASICVTERPSSAIVEAVRASIHVRAAAAAVAGRCGSVGNPRHRCERAFASRYGRRRPLWRRCDRAYTYVVRIGWESAPPVRAPLPPRNDPWTIRGFNNSSETSGWSRLSLLGYSRSHLTNKLWRFGQHHHFHHCSIVPIWRASVQ
jgi:hypothetical protein